MLGCCKSCFRSTHRSLDQSHDLAFPLNVPLGPTAFHGMAHGITFVSHGISRKIPWKNQAMWNTRSARLPSRIGFCIFEQVCHALCTPSAVHACLSRYPHVVDVDITLAVLVQHSRTVPILVSSGIGKIFRNVCQHFPGRTATVPSRRADHCPTRAKRHMLRRTMQV